MPGSIVNHMQKSGPVQCVRCQGFRHTSLNCPNPMACLRCGKNHHVSECPLRLEKEPGPPTCVNCGRRHRANHPACKVLQMEVQRALRPPPPEFVHTKMVESGTGGVGLMAAAVNPDDPPKPRRRRRGGRKHKKPRSKEDDTTPEEDTVGINRVQKKDDPTVAIVRRLDALSVHSIRSQQQPNLPQHRTNGTTPLVHPTRSQQQPNLPQHRTNGTTPLVHPTRSQQQLNLPQHRTNGTTPLVHPTRLQQQPNLPQHRTNGTTPFVRRSPGVSKHTPRRS